MIELPANPMRVLHDGFMFSCRTLYRQGIKPFEFDQRETEDYQQHVLWGRHLLEAVGIQIFLGHLLEGQYCVDLWAALIGLESGALQKGEILQLSGEMTTAQACLHTVRAYCSPTYSPSQSEAVAAWVAKMEAQYAGA